MHPSGGHDEPISSELVLVDEELARRARPALPDPPWLLPVIAELQQAEAAAAAAGNERPATTTIPARPPGVARRASTVATVALSLLGLVVLAALVFSFLPSPQEPTLEARPKQTASRPVPKAAVGARRKERTAKRTKAPRAATPQAPTKAEPATPKVRAKPRAITPKPTRAPKKPKPTTVARAERVFSWHRYRGAVYYQFYFQRGATTIYQTRTVLPTAALPGRLKIVPGTYHVVVRPALPSDAGISLGGAIFERTVKL